MDTRLDASRLESLLESAKVLSSSLKLEDQLNHLLRTMMGRLLVSRAAIAVKSGEGFHLGSVRGVPGLKAGQPFEPAKAAEYGFVVDAPIGDPESPVGYVFGGKPARGSMEDEEREFLSALLGIAATSISNSQAHAEVIRSNQELRALIDLGRGLAETIEPESVAQLLMLSISGRFGTRKHALLTWKDSQPPVERWKGLDAVDAATLKELLGDSPDPRMHGDNVALPVRSNDKTVGCVLLGPRLGGAAYSKADLEFIGGMIAQAAVALEGCWNFREALERQQLEKELNLAAAIQRDLFPKAIPTLANSDLAARNRQAKAVGGDYYDVLSYGTRGEQLLVVVDISGKGIAASLLMANIQATLRALLASDHSLPTIGARTNDLLYASTPSNKYATGIMVRYDPATGQCEYINGGHNDGVVLRANGDVELLTTTGLPIGLFPKREYEAKPFVLAPGDTLFLYSDGVPDACTADGSEFGMERLVGILKQHSSLPSAEVPDKMLTAIDDFVGTAPQFDDITMLVLRRQ